LTKNLIHTYKFSQQRAAAQSIARLMLETLKDFNSDETISKLGYLLVPVPTASSRARQRGFDHSILLARKLSALNGLSFERALIRLGSTRQLGAPRHIRQRQLTGSFAVRQRNKIAGRNVLLIDDVLTTGGTLIAAAKSLRKSGARRVDALVFAKRL
jgi:ComF family protein